MARNDVRLRDCGGLNSPPVLTWGVAAGTPPTIKAGEPTKLGTLPNIVLIADGDSTAASALQTGIAYDDSNEVAATAGDCEVIMPVPFFVYECKAKSAAAADTDAEIVALKLKKVVWDLTSSTFTIDTGAANGATNSLLIVGGDSTRSVIYFSILAQSSIYGNLTV